MGTDLQRREAQDVAVHPAPSNYSGVPAVIFATFVLLAALAMLAGYLGWGL